MTDAPAGAANGELRRTRGWYLLGDVLNAVLNSPNFGDKIMLAQETEETTPTAEGPHESFAYGSAQIEACNEPQDGVFLTVGIEGHGIRRGDRISVRIELGGGEETLDYETTAKGVVLELTEREIDCLASSLKYLLPQVPALRRLQAELGNWGDDGPGEA